MTLRIPVLIALLTAACGGGGSSDDDGTGGGSDPTSASSGSATTSSSSESDSSSETSGSSSDASSSDTTDGETEGDTDGDPSDWYPGIPYPTDDLPAGIMPTLPTPNAQPGWPYDPIAIELPEPSGAGNEYVVAVDGDDASAGNGGNGTMEAPRRSIPEGTFGAGTKIFVYGASSPYGTVDFDVGDPTTLTFECTADDPCFVVGIDTPRVGRRVDVVGSSHLVIDGFSIVDTPDADRAWGSMNFAESSYITLRNVEIRGDGSNTAGGAVMSMEGVEFMFTYRCQIHDAGSYETNASGLDVHGWRPHYRNRYLWLIESEVYHVQADSIQTGNSSNDNPQADSSHYIWIAGNTFYENYENALDNKNSYHVVFSSNDVHDFYASEGVGANGTAVILSNNGEGPWTGYHWAINNRIWNTELAIRDSGSENGERNFIIGNTVWNADAAFVQANNSTDRECWVIHNTEFGATVAVDVFQPGSNASLIVRGNVFHGGSLDVQGDVTATLANNILWETDVGSSWDAEEGNVVADPMLVDPGNGDMTPGAGSPAIDAIAQDDEVFGIFESMYGMDLREDLLGTTRPAGAGWEIGAVESR